MVSTLGEAWDAGWQVRVRCAWGRRDGMKSVRECMASAQLDMASLVWTRGRDMPLTMIGDRLRCPRCGSRRVRVFFDPPLNRNRQVAG